MTEIERVPSMAIKVEAPEPKSEPQRSATQPAPPEAPAATQDATAHALTVREQLRRTDAGFTAFRGAAARFPAERMDERLAEDGWTRKQMLAHIAAWHDHATERLAKFALNGKPDNPDINDDTFNARIARQAAGKTAGEVVKDVEATYNRLRRRLQSMSDAQLAEHDGWAASVIASNTYEHYSEHMGDVYLPETSQGQGRRR